jgi:hypothetical protein
MELESKDRNKHNKMLASVLASLEGKLSAILKDNAAKHQFVRDNVRNTQPPSQHRFYVEELLRKYAQVANSRGLQEQLNKEQN